MINRSDTFNAEAIYIDKLKTKDNIHFINNSNVTSLNAKDTLESIEITYNNGNKQNINVSGLFIAICRIPENEAFKKLINLNKAGYIIAKEDCHTNVPGIYVAGDNREKEIRQLVTATADGCVAAMEAIKYLNK